MEDEEKRRPLLNQIWDLPLLYEEQALVYEEFLTMPLSMVAARLCAPTLEQRTAAVRAFLRKLQGTQTQMVQPVMWSEDEVASKLLALYGDKVRAGRKREGPLSENPVSLINLSKRRIGDTFDIQGREKTFEVLVRGIAAMYNVFLHPETSGAEHMRDRPFFFGMVAFPGAGKTTMGTRGWSFLQENWLSLSAADRDAILREHLSEGEAASFVDMANASLRYNLVLYSDLSCNPALEFEELGFPGNHVLALRCLHAVVNVDGSLGYSSFIGELNRSIPGLLDPQPNFSLWSVLMFLGLCLDLQVEDSTNLMVTLFFDEVNAVPSNKETASWFQDMMSSYVRECHRMAMALSSPKRSPKGFIFPIFTYATTRYTAGDLLRTPSARARTIPVPFRLLTESESLQAVNGFVSWLAKSLDMRPPSCLNDSVRHLLRVAGGNPRALATVIEILGKQLRPQAARSLLDAFTLGIPKDVAERVLETLNDDCRDKYHSYLSGERFSMLLQVLAVSLTGHARCPRAGGLLNQTRHPLQLDDVERNSKVVEHDSVAYGHLEETGLVALTSEQAGDVGVSDLGVAPVKVRCSPMLISAAVSASPVSWPNLFTQDSRGKEVADLQLVVLRIWICQQVLQRERFTLEQVLSPGALIPRGLQGLEFQVDPAWAYKLHECSSHFETKEKIVEAFTSSNSLAILASGNDGFDSIIRLKLGEGYVFLVLESKQSTDEKTRGSKELLNNLKKDCGKFWRIPEPSQDDIVESGSYEIGVLQREYNTRKRNRKVVVDADRMDVDEVACSSKVAEEDVKEDYANASSSSNEVVDEDLKDLKDLIFLFCTNRRASRGFLKNLPRAQDTGRLMTRIIYQCEAEALNYGDASAVIAELRSKKRRYV